MATPAPLRASGQIVTPLHRRVLQLIAEAEADYGSIGLRLEGGTALAAYYLAHRLSEDLDLFGNPGMDARDLRAFVNRRLAAAALHVVGLGPASQGFAEMYVSELPATVAARDRQTIKLQFARSSPFKLAPPNPTAEGVRVASYRDVCAGKLHAICDRYEPRDFIDLHFIVTHQVANDMRPTEGEQRERIASLVADLETTDPGLTEAQVGQAVARGLNRSILAEFPLRILRPVTEEDVQATMRTALDECARLARLRANWQSPRG